MTGRGGCTGGCCNSGKGGTRTLCVPTLRDGAREAHLRDSQAGGVSAAAAGQVAAVAFSAARKEPADAVADACAFSFTTFRADRFASFFCAACARASSSFRFIARVWGPFAASSASPRIGQVATFLC